MNSRLHCKRSDWGFLKDDSLGPGKCSNSLVAVCAQNYPKRKGKEWNSWEGNFNSATIGNRSHVLCLEMGALLIESCTANDCQVFSGMMGTCVQHHCAVGGSVSLYVAGCCTAYCWNVPRVLEPTRSHTKKVRVSRGYSLETLLSCLFQQQGEDCRAFIVCPPVHQVEN